MENIKQNNKIKTVDSKRKKSIVLWIITNKNMSLSRKVYKLYLVLLVRIDIYLRQGSQCNLIVFSPLKSQISDAKTLRRAEQLMKKGYIVRIIEL